MADTPSSRNADGVFEPFRVADVPWAEFARGERFAMRWQYLSYLVIGSKHPHDVSVHTDTGRVSVKLLDEGYRGDATQDYWDGVDTRSTP